MLFPKHVLDHEGITDILHDNQGSLKCYSQGRNSCFDIEGGQNYKSLSFRPGYRSHDYRQKLMRLFSWQEELRRKAQLGRYRPSFGLIGRMAKVMLRLKSLYSFVGTLIT